MQPHREQAVGHRPSLPARRPASRRDTRSSSYVRSGQVPPYCVDSDPDRCRGAPDGQRRVTGHDPALAAGRTVVAVTAAGDGRTFVLGEQGTGSQGGHVLPVPAGFLRPARCADPAADFGGGREDDGRRWPCPPTAPGSRSRSRAGGGVQQVRLYPVSGGPARPGPPRAAPSAAPSQQVAVLGRQPADAGLQLAGGQIQVSVRLLNLGAVGRQPAGRQPAGGDAGQHGEYGADAVPVREPDPHPGRVGGRLRQRRDHTTIAKERGQSRTAPGSPSSPPRPDAHPDRGALAPNQRHGRLGRRPAVVGGLGPGAHRRDPRGRPTTGSG